MHFDLGWLAHIQCHPAGLNHFYWQWRSQKRTIRQLPFKSRSVWGGFIGPIGGRDAGRRGSKGHQLLGVLPHCGIDVADIQSATELVRACPTTLCGWPFGLFTGLVFGGQRTTLGCCQSHATHLPGIPS